MSGDDFMIVGRHNYSLVVREWYRAGVVDLYEAIRLLYNAGMRGKELTP